MWSALGGTVQVPPLEHMQPCDALKWLEETSDWVSLQRKAMEVESLVDFDSVSGRDVKTLDNIPSYFLDIKLEV